MAVRPIDGDALRKELTCNFAGEPFHGNRKVTIGEVRRIEAADAIEQLQAENEKLKRALAEMWFAYVNKDGEIPHTYEEEAVELAQEILGPWGECMPRYLRRGPHKED